MSLSLQSPFSEQFCLDCNSADGGVHHCFEENSEGGRVKYLTSSSPVHAFQLCIINQLIKLTPPSPPNLGPHTGHSVLHWLCLLELNLQMTGSWHLLLSHLHNFSYHELNMAFAARAMLSEGWISATWAFYCFCMRVPATQHIEQSKGMLQNEV